VLFVVERCSEGGEILGVKLQLGSNWVNGRLDWQLPCSVTGIESCAGEEKIEGKSFRSKAGTMISIGQSYRQANERGRGSSRSGLIGRD